jgi:hypothetical protein
MIKAVKKPLLDTTKYLACRIRPAKNFLGVLGRATRRLAVRSEENLVQRAVKRLYGRKACLDGTSPDPLVNKF